MPVDYTFDAEPERLSKVIAAIEAMDPAELASQAREATSIPLTDGMLWAIIVGFLLKVLTEMIKQVRPLAQPYTDVMAEDLRERHRLERENPKG